MNNIEKIIDRINSDAESRIDKIKQAANEECAKFREQSEKDAQNAAAGIIENAKAEAETFLQRSESTAQMEARKYTLGVKQEVISRVFQKAVDDILSMPENEYAAFLARLAADSSESGEEEIIFSQQDRERVGEKVTFGANELLKQAGKKGALTLSADTRPIRGGFILSSGKIEISCQIDAIVNSLKNELTIDIANILFE